MLRERRALALAGVSGLIVTLAACGTRTTDGTTPAVAPARRQKRALDPRHDRTVTALDPAGSYDLGSWTLEYNIYEQLLTIPAGAESRSGTRPSRVPYDDPQTLTCTLKRA